MKVLVIGAGGKTGRLAVEKALAAGHNVVALLHSPESEDRHPMPLNAEVIHGDVRNPSRLRLAMLGCQAVIDAIGGTTPFMETDLETTSAKVVLDVMKETGAKRLIVVSVMGVGDSAEHAGWFYEHLLMPVFLRGALKDKDAMEVEVRLSGLEWVVVRPPMLSDSEATGQVHVVAETETAHKITRADLAQFLVDQLTSDAYVGQAVTVTNS